MYGKLGGDGSVGSLREVSIISGLPATTNTEQPQVEESCMKEEEQRKNISCPKTRGEKSQHLRNPKRSFVLFKTAPGCWLRRMCLKFHVLVMNA
ncbi:hypothetical protein SUGI_0564610 [Cryptomeria japonica]|nr:hypothetical protein SUGI_0564610 [Cryptomeria japonica]